MLIGEVLVDEDAQIGLALERGDRLDGRALGACRADQPDLHLSDIGLSGIDELNRVAGAAAILDIDIEAGFLEPALVLGQMHRRLHAPGREIQPDRELVLRADAGATDRPRTAEKNQRFQQQSSHVLNSPFDRVSTFPPFAAASEGPSR